MKSRIQKKGLAVLSAVALIIVLITAVSMSVSNGDEGFLGNVLSTITRPARTLMSKVADTLEQVYGAMYAYDKLEAERDALALRVSELEQDAREFADVKEENERLRDLLDLSTRHSDYDYASAKVIAWSASSFSSTFTINKGSDDGLTLNQCVITETGYLVGSITELSRTTATVTTILNTNAGVGAIVYESGDTGVALGDFTLMQQGLLKLTYLEEGAELLEGFTVTTSGKSGLYPQDLVIGKITQVVSSASGLDDYAVLEPAAEIRGLSNVYVVTDFVQAE